VRHHLGEWPQEGLEGGHQSDDTSQDHPVPDDGLENVRQSGEVHSQCGTIWVNGHKKAWRAVISPTTQARNTLCQMTALKISASRPT